MADNVDVTIVTMVFDASDPGGLLGILAKYVVLTRMVSGCRNVDLAASVTVPGRLIIIEKWESAEAQRAHFDATETVEMADACRGLLVHAPTIDLLEGISAHDLR